jgi:hypothetical protein
VEQGPGAEEKDGEEGTPSASLIHRILSFQVHALRPILKALILNRSAQKANPRSQLTMFTAEDFHIESFQDFLDVAPIFIFMGLVSPFLIVAYTVGFISDKVGWLD